MRSAAGKFAHSVVCVNTCAPHNGSTYDYVFIIKDLAKEFDDQFECLGENTEKYKAFSVPIKK